MSRHDYQKHGEEKLDILFVLVLYKTKLEHSVTFLSLLNSLSQIGSAMDLFVYDNSPETTEHACINEPGVDVIYINDLTNGGVSKAYNTGASLAVKLNKKWLMLLDQDTTFPVETLPRYLSAIREHPGEKLFSPMMIANQKTIISPGHFKFMRGFAARHVQPGVHSLRNFSIINCGMCIDVTAFFKNGGYNDQIRLDFSDHDFIRRYKKTVGDSFVVIDLRVNHLLSSATKNNFNSDIVRFDYYLEGAKYMSSSLTETFWLKLNALLRSIKLSLIHRNIGFLIKLIKWI